MTVSTNFDWLPEKAEDLFVTTSPHCVCRFDDVPDPTDVETDCSPKPFGKWYPRTIWTLVEYNPTCRYGDHAAKAAVTKITLDNRAILEG
jgi:hypothetical protein